ncbi:type II toxin-antitoxin system RnlA family toxin [Desulfotalea psychrophila]|uniref:Bacterial toxin RNase RnlA/LsoA N-terminal repeated domain-containing protein n=1 Tax=Desulfotalea psychrophila (strain LSv54 / DSM 12343) TaxID=177439 RepID=Q6AIF4_DESPS|nr:type II toxin-antitoxin system RnlA family toxin [Desulfotalea psychrophila]CAG37893.1 hypothetical protein DPPB29 [Desulfotalea psychrophila LSv54]
MSFRDQNITIGQIEDHLQLLSKKGQTNKCVNKGRNVHCSFLDENGYEKCLLIFYPKKFGITTIQFSCGKNKELSCEKAKQIINNFDVSSAKSVNCTFKGLLEEEFGIFEEYVIEELPDISSKIQKDDKTKKTISYSGKYSDTVTVTFYKTTGTTLLQGRPLPAFFEIKALFAGIVESEQLISSDKENFSIKVPETGFLPKLEGYMPNAFSFLDAKIKDIIVPSLFFGEIDC